MGLMRFVVPLISAAISVSFAAEPSQKASGGEFTADELILRADEAYNARNFSGAADLYQRFFDSFAKAKEPQIHDIIRRRRPVLAMSLVRSKKFTEAKTAIEAALAMDPPPDTKDLQELTFWLGVSQLEEKDYAEAAGTFRKFLGLFPQNSLSNEAYRKAYPATSLVPEAQILIGTALLLDEKYTGASDHFSAIKGGLEPSGRGRATVMELYSLLQADQTDKALALVKEEFPRMGDIAQLVSFQTLALDLGDRLLEAGRLRDAIACLQRVWPQDRLLKHQEARLEDLKSKLAALEADPMGDPLQKLQLAQTAAKVQRETDNFRKVANFDAALRMRLAGAYLQMGRYRESALILESILAELPPDPIVEQASVNLVQSWFELGRWPRASSAGETFSATFPESKSLPLVLYLKGLAEQNDQNFQASIDSFSGLWKNHPESEYAPRAKFMEGFTFLLAERNPEAVQAFDTFLKKYPKHELADAAEYWRGMGLSLDKRYAEAREAMGDYLGKRQEGTYRSAAFFRKAYCAHQLEDYGTSIRELSDYLRKFPGGEETAEARVLLGDALMNEGRMEEGIEAFAGIPKTSQRFYEEGVFKTAKALRLMEEPDRLLALMDTFRQENPKSPRVAEAIYETGRVFRERGEPEKAKTAYWEAIEKYGPDPSIRSTDDLFPALAKLYKGPEEQATYIEKLRKLETRAARDKQNTLLVRSLWAQALALKKSDPERSRSLLVEAYPQAVPPEINPAIMADIAEALETSGKTSEAEKAWRDLVKWNPRAPQKDRALASLGFLELGRGNEKAALGYFDRFARESLGSLRYGEVMLARAKLQAANGDREAARASLASLLESEFSTGPQKAEALYLTGTLHLKDKRPDLAVPYFQRVYVMHAKWRDWVARSYLESGRAFEQLNDKLSARRTYSELASRKELGEFPETAKARERLDALGGPPPQPEPSPAG